MMVLPSRACNFDLGSHLVAQLRVEIRQWLVERKHFGSRTMERPIATALPLAARLARFAFEQVLNAQDRGGLVDAALDFRSGVLRRRRPNAMFSNTDLCG